MTPSRRHLEETVIRLREAGCVAAEEEAAELWAASGTGHGGLAELVERRERGEPLAWITGLVSFCGVSLRIDPGVYVPRWQTEPLARRAAALLPPGGSALDLCTGSGALAVVMQGRVPGAAVLATDTSEVAVACARANGVDARRGDLDGPVPTSWEQKVDVLTAVAPYVPTGALGFLPRDVRDHEPVAGLDGGPRGLAYLEKIVARAPRWLRPGRGTLLVELGAEQDQMLQPSLDAAGFGRVRILRDEEGDVRGLEAVMGS